MKIGYACVHIGSEQTRMRSLRLKNADEDNLRRVTAGNLDALERILKYNAENAIKLYRISSDIIPFGSHPANTFDWQTKFSDKLRLIGDMIIKAGIRVSMHPGQYTVLNSPNEETALRAVEDLNYHCAFLDSLGCGKDCKIVLHAGGAYGDKSASLRRFAERYKRLIESVKGRLVIENDDRTYNIADILEISDITGVPVVFDNLHNELNSPGKVVTANEWIDKCAKTWKNEDGIQKIHYSQQALNGRRGAHSDFIKTDVFLKFYEGLGKRDVDIMLEVKDKNLSAVKCSLLVGGALHVKFLEHEWAKYKYLVLSKSALVYNSLRQLLKDKKSPDAAAFYRLIESALEQQKDIGAGINAVQHIWGYFKKEATDIEKNKFTVLIREFSEGKTGYKLIKRFLFRMATKYKQEYLLDSLYFYMD